MAILEGWLKVNPLLHWYKVLFGIKFLTNLTIRSATIVKIQFQVMDTIMANKYWKLALQFPDILETFDHEKWGTWKNLYYFSPKQTLSGHSTLKEFVIYDEKFNKTKLKQINAATMKYICRPIFRVHITLRPLEILLQEHKTQYYGFVNHFHFNL